MTLPVKRPLCCRTLRYFLLGTNCCIVLYVLCNRLCVAVMYQTMRSGFCKGKRTFKFTIVYRKREKSETSRRVWSQNVHLDVEIHGLVQKKSFFFLTVSGWYVYVLWDAGGNLNQLYLTPTSTFTWRSYASAVNSVHSSVFGCFPGISLFVFSS